MLSLRTNISSLSAQTQLQDNNADLAQSLGRLASGLRVRTAADDAAGLAISEDFKATIRSLHQSKRNANDGVSLSQTADGALSEVGALLRRMRELAVQSRNGTYNTGQRVFMDNEFQELKSEIDRIVATTEFNGISLLDGTQAAGIEFQVGVDTSANDRLTLSMATAYTSALGIDLSTISGVASADTAITTLDTAITGISTRRAEIGAMQNRLTVTISNIDSYATNLSSANSRIVDIDVASESAALTKSNILVQSGAAMLAQANQAPQIALSLIG